MSLSEANVVVIVFVMEGCGACEDYLPRFKKIAVPYQKEGVQIFIYDANSKNVDVQRLADRIGVEATPTTAVLPRGPGMYKVEGALPDDEIKQVLALALSYQRRGK